VLSILIATLAGISFTLIVLSRVGSWYVQLRCLRLAKGFQYELMRRGQLIPRYMVGMNQPS
jgi:hypothetical protein